MKPNWRDESRRSAEIHSSRKRIFFDNTSNFHPYECNGEGQCIHCDRTVLQNHNPETCELCKETEDGRTPSKIR